MKVFKRFSLFFVLVIFLATLAGCGSKTTTSNGTSTKTNTTVNKNETKKNESKSETKSVDLEKGVIKEVDPSKKVYITAREAKSLIDEKKDDVVVAEVTWGEEKDSPDFLKKHIPNAIHINTDMVEEGPIWNLKSSDELLKNFLNYGITSDKILILYGPGIATDRVAYAALYLGVKDVKIIDGRLAAWEKEGYPTEEGSVKPTPATDFGVDVPLHPEYLISLDETVKKLKDDPNFSLVSVRSKEEWLGITSGYTYIPKAGEPKGAVWGNSGNGNSGMENYLNSDETVKDFKDIVSMWKENGFDVSNDMAFYCGTGWRAATPFLLMYERGYVVKMFDGGWNEWQMHDDLDVQVGDPNSSDVKFVKVKDLTSDKAAK